MTRRSYKKEKEEFEAKFIRANKLNKKLQENLEEVKQELETKKNEYSNLKKENIEKKEQIKDFETSVDNLTESNEKLQEDFEKKDQELQKINSEHNTLKEDNQNNIDKIKELTSEIDEHNTKLMAVEFEKVAKEYKNAREKWLIISYIFFIITSGILLYLYDSSLSAGLTLAERITSGFVGFFFIGVLAWMFKQFNFYRNLNVDMTHRRNLAQTYHNILRSGEVEDEIKSALATALIRFLTSPPNTKEGKGIFNDILNDKLNK